MYGVNFDANLEQFHFYTQNIKKFEDQKYDWIRDLASKDDELTQIERYIFIALSAAKYERDLDIISNVLEDDYLKLHESITKMYSDYFLNYRRGDVHRNYFRSCKCFHDLLLSKLGITDTIPTTQTPNTGVIQVVEAEIDLIVFERLSHKLVYLHEIGVYDFLADKYKGLDKTPFANLVASMSGITDPKEIENLRKCISYIGIKDTKNPINKKSLNAVRAELLKIGISKLSN